jgi:hypothetical protein
MRRIESILRAGAFFLGYRAAFLINCIAPDRFAQSPDRYAQSYADMIDQRAHAALDHVLDAVRKHSATTLHEARRDDHGEGDRLHERGTAKVDAILDAGLIADVALHAALDAASEVYYTAADDARSAAIKAYFAAHEACDGARVAYQIKIVGRA